MGNQPSKPVPAPQRTALLPAAGAMLVVGAAGVFYRWLSIPPRITVYVPPVKVPFDLGVNCASTQDAMDPPPYGQAPIAEKTDPLSRQISNLLLSTAAKSALDRKELFPTHDDWLLFDIANERLITNKTVSNSVRGGGVYLVVSSAAAAQNMLHEIARRYISEEVLSKAKSGGGYLAPIWGRISGGKVQGETGDGGDVKAS